MFLVRDVENEKINILMKMDILLFYTKTYNYKFILVVKQYIPMIINN
ncbi:MAG: hypothetical protein ACTS8Y_02215 [Arsenophonus sp. ER-EMS1-MAG3]